MDKSIDGLKVIVAQAMIQGTVQTINPPIYWPFTLAHATSSRCAK